MFLNYDSLLQMSLPFAVVSIIAGSLITYSCFNIYTHYTTQNINDSLINTPSNNYDLSNLDLSNNLTSLAESKLIDTGVQTDILLETANTHVNTGMQTSGRMWLETVKNWINEILASPTTTNPNPHTPQYVDVGVQTNGMSLWATVKQWFLEVCSIRSSELSSMGYSKVDKWRNNIDTSLQSVDLHDSESPLITVGTYNEEYDTSLENLVDPNDSASNVSEVISETNLQEVTNVSRVYDMNNVNDVLDLMNDPTIVFSVNSAYDPADDLITLIIQFTTL